MRKLFSVLTIKLLTMKKLTFTLLFVLGASFGLMAQNIIANGNFDTDNTGWAAFANEGTQVYDNVTDGDFTGNCMHVKVTEGSADRTVIGDAWKKGVRYNVSFPKDAHYNVKFKAKASTALQLQFMFQQNFDPWASWGGTNVDLTTSVQSFDLNIEVSHEVGGIWSFVFYFGHLQTDDEIWIDDVEITQIAGGTNIVAGDFETDVLNFENHVPGWGLVNADGADAIVTIDTENPISGAKSMMVESVQSSVDGWRIHVKWWCYPTIGQRYWLRFKAKASSNVSQLVVELVDDWPDRQAALFYNTYDLTTEAQEFNFIGPPVVTEYDKYNLNFWTAMVPNGEKVWFDDVELFPFYYVTGLISNAMDEPMPGVTVADGVVTDDDGFYAVIVPQYEDITVTPTLEGYVFDPPSFSVTNAMTDNSSDFIGSENVSVAKMEKTGIKVYPNPVDDIINVSLGENAQTGMLTLYDISGRNILHRELTNSMNTIDISSLKSGVYFVNITNDQKQNKIVRLVKD
ncbi:MAG: T9SS type A sorting domain-containing protein [Bacteroidales bacterium]|nr:T9SS type A sorting domain-containing protein [Bacteroidales bacterium]MCF8346453.1 T9SS type A sorting domain-containing protein [Bacteroidales bacterium]